MNTLNLDSDIDIILEKSKLVVYSDIKYSAGWTITLEGSKDTIVGDSTNYRLENPLVTVLKQMYFQHGKELQLKIAKKLLSSLELAGPPSKIATLALIETSNIKLLVDYITTNWINVTQQGYLTAMSILSGYICYFWPEINLTQIRELRVWSDQTKTNSNPLGEAGQYDRRYAPIFNLANAIYNQTTHILAIDVTARVTTGHNPEINEDREQIKEAVVRFGLPNVLSETLDKIDSKFSNAHDAFDFKGCMDLIRGFTEILYRAILDNYGDEGKKIDEKDAKDVAKFFRYKGLISDHFAEILAHLRHFLSDEASHRVKSREEDARLTKNMVIEMSLYLLRRFENN